jgi:hypothetical protein
MIRLPAIAASVLVLGGCSKQPPVPEVDVTGAKAPAVAAEYRTTHTDAHGPASAAKQPLQWRFWREAGRVATENLSAGSGELWQQDGQAIIHRKFFHDDKRAIEWQTDDLRMTGTLPAWPRLALLIDPQTLGALTLKRAGWQDNYPYRRYAGVIDGTRWDITIRTDLMLPVSIDRQHDGGRELTMLKSVYAADAAPWQPTDAGQYEVIDFSDLGDRERDPFVQKIQGQLPGVHAHSH